MVLPGGGYVLDPHTAVAVAACLGREGSEGAVVSGDEKEGSAVMGAEAGGRPSTR